MLMLPHFVKQDAYIDTFTRKYMDEFGAYRLPRYYTPAVKPKLIGTKIHILAVQEQRSR